MTTFYSLPDWRPTVMTLEALTGQLHSVRGGQKASVDGAYDDLFGRDGLRVAMGILATLPDPAIDLLLALAQFLGVTTNPLTNEFPGAVPHQVHRKYVNGTAALDELLKEVAYWAGKWGVPLLDSPYFGPHFVIYNGADEQCLFVIVAAMLDRYHPGKRVLRRRFRHWATDQDMDLGSAVEAVLDLIMWLIADSDLGLYELPNTNPRQTSPSGVLFDGFDAWWRPVDGRPAGINWKHVAYIHTQALAYEALLCGADLLPDHKNAADWRAAADSLRRRTVLMFGLDWGDAFPPAAIDRDGQGRPQTVDLESLAAVELLGGRFLKGLPHEVDIIRQLVRWLYSPEVMTAVGPRCQPLKYASYEGEYCPYQGTPSVWAILGEICAGGLHNNDLDPLAYDLSVLRVVGGLDRTGTAIESWPVHRETGAVSYHPYDFGPDEAELVMACAERGQRSQAWSISSGYAALWRHHAQRPSPRPGTWRHALCAEALGVAADIPPAAFGYAEVPIFIDTETGQKLKERKAATMGLAA